MPFTDRETLKQVKTETAAHIRSAHTACDEAAEHVRHSKTAIKQSLDLLSDTRETRLTELRRQRRYET